MLITIANLITIDEIVKLIHFHLINSNYIYEYNMTDNKLFNKLTNFNIKVRVMRIVSNTHTFIIYIYLYTHTLYFHQSM